MLLVSKRRSHSSIDKLPPALQDTLRRMVVDGLWPADFPGQTKGRPTYDHIVEYCSFQGYSVSRSAIGRWAKGLLAFERLVTANLITRKTMGELDGEDATKNAKAAAQVINAIAMDFAVSHDNYTSKQIMEVSRAVANCASVAINADKHLRQQIAEKVSKAAASTKTKLKKAGVDRRLIQEIIDEHLGVTKA